MKSENTTKLVEALVKVQGQLRSAALTKKNSHFNSKYSTIEDVWDVCRRPLSENGLAITQTYDSAEGVIYLITTLRHVSDQWIESKMPLLLPRQDSQAIGSATTYAKKYSLCALLGIICKEDDVDANDKDDDGNSCAEEKPAKNKKTDDDGNSCAEEKPAKNKKTVEINTITKDQALEVKEFLDANSQVAINFKKVLNERNITSLTRMPLALYETIKKSMCISKDTTKQMEL